MKKNSQSNLIQILLVDDHAVVREGYRALLERQVNIEVVAEAENGEKAYKLFKEFNPDIVIMDLSLPDMSGLETILRIKKYNSNAQILAFSMYNSPIMAQKTIEAGARGYVTKSSSPETLINAIYDLHNNKLTFSPDIAKSLAIEQVGLCKDTLKNLSVREYDILRMIVKGKTTQDIANRLNLSSKTVSNTHYIIKKKLGVSTDVELTHLALKNNVINISEHEV